MREVPYFQFISDTIKNLGICTSANCALNKSVMCRMIICKTHYPLFIDYNIWMKMAQIISWQNGMLFINLNCDYYLLIVSDNIYKCPESNCSQGSPHASTVLLNISVTSVSSKSVTFILIQIFCNENQAKENCYIPMYLSTYLPTYLPRQNYCFLYSNFYIFHHLLGLQIFCYWEKKWSAKWGLSEILILTIYIVGQYSICVKGSLNI
jgi:hypothetical protein